MGNVLQGGALGVQCSSGADAACYWWRGKAALLLAKEGNQAYAGFSGAQPACYDVGSAFSPAPDSGCSRSLYRVFRGA